jgi:putative Mn2+ efflux pump MntP
VVWGIAIEPKADVKIELLKSCHPPGGSAIENLSGSHGTGLLITSLPISLDSLGVGIALPAVGIPLSPLLITVSITTTIFTFVGLAFGAHLGERYEHGAERAAGAMLVMLATLFAVEQLF